MATTVSTPGRRAPSRYEFWLVFAVVAFPVHFWAILNFLREVPGYILHIKIWDILGIFAYTQFYALLESLLVLGFLILLAFVTPRRFLRDHFVPQGSILAVICSLWVLPLHYQNRIAQAFSFQVIHYMIFLVAWLCTFVFALLAMSSGFRRRPRLEASLCAFAEKLTVLAVLYLVIDAASISLILYRNLVG